MREGAREMRLTAVLFVAEVPAVVVAVAHEAVAQATARAASELVALASWGHTGRGGGSGACAIGPGAGAYLKLASCRSPNDALEGASAVDSSMALCSNLTELIGSRTRQTEPLLATTRQKK